ncbi:hypothetical protein BC940DRAFT_313871 [Gongronella butleri]|nr:hypothetical protein BC940DRAFT_313871 [Gongronella butleri]
MGLQLQRITYAIALWFFNILAGLFFREIRSRGSHRIPMDKVVIFVVGPHSNQFVDPIMVMRECKRQVSFLIAEKSMHQRGIGFFARMVNAIPVIRPQDLAVKGKGTIQLYDRKLEPLRIVGQGTSFLTQLAPRSLIALPNKAGQVEVEHVVSDTELLIKREVKDLKALALLSEGTAYKCVPHVDQDAVYRYVHDQLRNNQCITIFPEGGSHDRAELLPLKAGVTLMALGAMAKYPGLDVKIVPCGLNYFHAHRFRSRAVIEFGNPISITPDMVEKYQTGGPAKREACGKLLDAIYDGLKSVTVNAESYETLMMIQAARRLYKPAHRKLPLSSVVDLNRRFVIGYNLFKNEPKVEDLRQRVLAYNQLLKYYGIRDHQVSKTDLGRKSTLLLLMRRLVFFAFYTLCSFPGAILNLPVVIVAKVISAKKADAALRGSNVKIAGRDVLATWKLLVGLVLVPTLYAFYGLVVFLSVLRYDLPLQWMLAVPSITIVIVSMVSYASLRFGEVGMDIARSLQPLVMALLDPESAQVLRSNREKLMHDITDVINEFGPQAFSDFDADYISRHLPSSPTPTPSKSTGSTNGSSFNLTAMRQRLPRLNSGFFQQAKRMDWLDDKNIFAWDGAKTVSATKEYLEVAGEDFLRWMSRSGSESSTPLRSRSNSFSNEPGLSMTSLQSLMTPTDSSSSSSSMAAIDPAELAAAAAQAGLKQRPTFHIQDIDDETFQHVQ